MIIAYVSKTGELPFQDMADQVVTVDRFNSLDSFIDFYENSTNRDISLIYEVSEPEEIKQLRKISFKQNIFILIAGPANPEFSLLAGKMGADAYIDGAALELEKIKEQIINSRRTVKERFGANHVSVFTGNHGGIGTTTIAMHTAGLIAAMYPERKVLFIDVAHTKAISNLFFNQPHPSKTLADIAVNGYASPELLQEITIKHDKNLFFIPGIQKHSDREELDKHENVQRILDFIAFAKEYFNDIILDAGVFEDIHLKTALSEITDSIYVIVEFSIPSLSILKTQLDFIYRYGWAPKSHLLINRHDAQGTFDVEEAVKIIRQNELYPYKIDFMLPNDSKNLREAWNEATLVTQLFPDTAFVKTLREFVETQFYGEGEVPVPPSAQQGYLAKRLSTWLGLK